MQMSFKVDDVIDPTSFNCMSMTIRANKLKQMMTQFVMKKFKRRLLIDKHNSRENSETASVSFYSKAIDTVGTVEN